MSNYLHCPVCSELYNNQLHIPKYSQCGGVCCSLCISTPCSLCRQQHSEPALEYLPLKDYIRANFIDCTCSKQAAVFIDGNNFLPYCRLCLKHYQKGVEMENNSFREFINNIFVYFVNKLVSQGEKEIVWNMIENGNKGLKEKLMMVRMAHQFFNGKVYCEVHLEKISKGVSKDLEFLCDNHEGTKKLTDFEGCKVLIKKYLNTFGLINETLLGQLNSNKNFSPIKSIFQAKLLKRGIRPTDICSFCKKILALSSAFQILCKSPDNTQNYHIVCKKCSKLTQCLLDENGMISNKVQKNIEYSNTCSNCDNKFLIQYKTPLENQDLIPFELICDHSVCRSCSNKAKDNKIFCKICQVYYPYVPKLNMILLDLLNQKEIFCPNHHLTIVQYNFHPTFSLFCDKCHKDFKGYFISKLYPIINNIFRHLVDLLSAESLIPKLELLELQSTTLRKKKLESIARMDLKNWFTIPDHVNIIDQSNVFTIIKSKFLIQPSISILITSLELVHKNIEGKLRISQYIDDKTRALKTISVDLSINESTIDFSHSGYLPLLKDNYYEFDLYDLECFYSCGKLEVDSHSNTGSLILSIYPNIPINEEESKEYQYSLIKCINFLKILR